MNPLLDVLRILSVVAPLAAAGIRLITHLTGADKHKTVAGEIADHLDEAGSKAKELLNGVIHGDPSQDPPT